QILVVPLASFDGSFLFREEQRFSASFGRGVYREPNRLEFGDIIRRDGGRIPVSLVAHSGEGGSNDSAGERKIGVHDIPNNDNDSESQRDLQRLQGTWEIVAGVKSSDAEYPPKLEAHGDNSALRVHIEGNTFTGPYIAVPLLATPGIWTFELSASSPHNRILFRPEDDDSDETAFAAFYEFEGDLLKLSVIRERPPKPAEPGVAFGDAGERKVPYVVESTWSLKRVNGDSTNAIVSIRTQTTKSEATFAGEMLIDGEVTLQIGRTTTDAVVKRSMRLPAGRFQASIFFLLSEQGGKQVPTLALKLDRGNEGERVITEPLHSKSLPADGKFRFRDSVEFVNGRFAFGDIVYPGGAKLPVLLNVSSGDGDTDSGPQDSNSAAKVDWQEDLKRLQGA
ncbi:MAG: hypothetical protein KDD44_14445, partial [Bdellovibrionales bacterium]|nr:hypothetical protein [Bdellovibrionales bacterium]